MFWELNTCRQYGMGACPLTAGEIMTMCGLYEIEASSRKETFDLIKAMDSTWLEWANTQASK